MEIRVVEPFYGVANENDVAVITADIDSYVKGLKHAFNLTGLIINPENESYLDDLYKKANEAGDKLFGPEREKFGVRTSTFADDAMTRLGGFDPLKKALDIYRDNMVHLRTDLAGEGNPYADKLREETIELQNKLIGEGITRIVF